MDTPKIYSHSHPFRILSGMPHPLIKLVHIVVCLALGLYFVIEFESLVLKLFFSALFLGASLVFYKAMKRHLQFIEHLIVTQNELIGLDYQSGIHHIPFEDLQGIEYERDLWYGIPAVILVGKKSNMKISQYLEGYDELIQSLEEELQEDHLESE